MDNSNRTFSDLIKLVSSWLPRRSEPDNVSRDFWMPDHSCRVCYDCDAQFTILNRRHHCRRCGRIFCGKCTANSIPVISEESGNNDEGDRLRVCNFCRKQWEQEAVAAHKRKEANVSSSLSTLSLLSTKSVVTVNSTATSAASYSTGVYHHPLQGSVGCLECGSQDNIHDKQDVLACEQNADVTTNKETPSSIQYGYYTARSDDEDEYGSFISDRQVNGFDHSERYSHQVDCDDLDALYCSSKTYTSEDHVSEEVSPPVGHRNLHHVISDDKLADEAEHDSSDFDAASSIYMENTETEPVDFENNGALWVPPEPDDEEDEKELNYLDDDDDNCNVGDWDRLRSSSSFGSGEYRARERSCEEQKMAMKSVVEVHFRALISQLLQAEDIMENEQDKVSWLDIVTSLSWEAANFLKPDTSRGGGMDPGGHVKVKCLACGHRSESILVKGVVCKKNIAHRRMTSRIDKPRFLLLGGALEYQRVTNLLSSIDTLLQQETDHLKMAVAKIVAQQPNILLVEKTVARCAQDLLLEKDISLVLNMKRPLLERIARCTGAQIVPSIDRLSSQKLGFCESFHVDKFSEVHEVADQGKKKSLKTLMFFEGCPKPLGCTVLLKGGSIVELKRVKHVVQYGIFAAYHLAVETSFLADEGASLPELPLKSPITVALPDKPPSMESYICTVPGFTIPTSWKTQDKNDSSQFSSSGSSVVPALSDAIITEAPSLSGDSRSSQTVHSHKLHSHDGNIAIVDRASELDISIERHVIPLNSVSSDTAHPFNTTNKGCSADCQGQTIALSHNSVNSSSWHDQQKIDDEQAFRAKNLPANVTQYATKDLALPSFPANPVVGQRHETLLAKDELISSDHQSILFSLSTRSVWKGTVCERSQLFRIKYYGSFDKPLGRFLRDHLFDQGYQCHSCDMPSEAHVHCYTHQQGSLTISVSRQAELLLSGERDGKIWMWHRCLKCPRVNGFPPSTRRVVMSDAAWGLSFGKFLELSFSNNAAASRLASCGHSLHRDCLRFYGLGKMIACLRYAPIHVNSVYLPPHKLEFDYEQQDWVQEEANEVADRGEILFDEVQKALHLISDKKGSLGKSTEPGNHISELEDMLRKEKAEFEECLQKIVKKDVPKGQPVMNILEINKLRRQLVYQSFLWDHRLIYAVRSGRSPQEFSSSCIIKEKNANFKDAINDLNMLTSPKDGQKDDVVQQNFSSEESCKENTSKLTSEADSLHDSSPQQKSSEPDLASEQDNKVFLYSSVSVSEQLVPLEPGLIARRTFSDGHFPRVIDVSDAIEAKWTGKEVPTLTTRSSSDSPVSVDVVPAPSHYEDPEEQQGMVMTPTLAYQSFHKLGDGAEDMSSWMNMPFSSFYNSLNKQTIKSFRLDDIDMYTPVYVSFYRGLELQNGSKYRIPAGPNEVVIPIYDDEPTSLIAYALSSYEYHAQVSDEQLKDGFDTSVSMSACDTKFSQVSEISEENASELSKPHWSAEDGDHPMSGSRSSLASDQLVYNKSLHILVNFAHGSTSGKVKYSITCYHAKQFDALRKTCCPSELDYIRSLSRCKKWGAQGGKSNVFFAKSLDDRFIIKQVTKTELESFLKFAPSYFNYLSDTIRSGSPTCLAKILGIYQVKTLRGGKEVKMDVLVMENLLFRRHLTRLYDLKGSTRSRYNPDSSGNNKVLLDQNLIESMPTSPIFVGNKAKRLLERGVWNDTAFLASIDVMDYSLLVGIDEQKHELVVGIIDFMRQYTWDKHLETWVKASGILGGPKNVSPTVISPKQYKKRFRKAMSTYFLVVPDQWSPPPIIRSKSGPAEAGQEDEDGSTPPDGEKFSI